MKVLENHHCSLTFKILCQQNSNILANTTESTFKYIRKMMIYSILSTDMKKHFEILKEFQLQSKDIKENSMEASLLLFFLKKFEKYLNFSFSEK